MTNLIISSDSFRSIGGDYIIKVTPATVKMSQTLTHYNEVKSFIIPIDRRYSAARSKSNRKMQTAHLLFGGGRIHSDGMAEKRGSGAVEDVIVPAQLLGVGGVRRHQAEHEPEERVSRPTRHDGRADVRLTAGRVKELPV